MEVTIARSFVKDLKSAPKAVQQAADEAIKKLIAANSMQATGLDHIKMEGQRKGENYYRISIGEWRIGVEYVHPQVIVLRILVRGSIYKHFPPGA